MARDTVFAPSFGNRPAQLVGREEILGNFLRGLKTDPGSKERAVLFLGQRGSGKTVLLLEFADLAKENGFIVASPTIVSSGMLERIVEKIQDEGEQFLRNNRKKLSGGSLGAFGFSVGLQFSEKEQEKKSFSYKLSKLCDALNSKGKGVLILIDEVQANSPDLKELIIAYQEMVGRDSNIALVLAGLPGAVSSTLNDKVLTFLNRARKTELKELRIRDVDAYYKQAFSKMKINVPDYMRKDLSEATKGSPYMMQLLGHYLTLFAEDGQIVTDKDFRQALQAAEEDYINDICRTTLHTLSETDEIFLRAMAQDDDISKVADIAERMAVKADYIQIYKRRLLDAGVIEQCGRGMLRFAVPYLRACLLDDLMLDEQELLTTYRSLDSTQKKRLMTYLKKLRTVK